MLKRAMAAFGFLALTGMQAPPAPHPAMSLWRLDCGDFDIHNINAFMSDTSEYPDRPKHLVGSCYLIRHGDAYLLWDTGITDSAAALPNGVPGAEAGMTWRRTGTLLAALAARTVAERGFRLVSGGTDNHLF